MGIWDTTPSGRTVREECLGVLGEGRGNSVLAEFCSDVAESSSHL
jgi:hypothetical protein